MYEFHSYKKTHIYIHILFYILAEFREILYSIFINEMCAPQLYAWDLSTKGPFTQS